MKNVFVGNMSFETTESGLRSIFEPFGEITRVNLITDRDTGRARGFGFVRCLMTTKRPSDYGVEWNTDGRSRLERE